MLKKIKTAPNQWGLFENKLIYLSKTFLNNIKRVKSLENVHR